MISAADLLDRRSYPHPLPLPSRGRGGVRGGGRTRSRRQTVAPLQAVINTYKGKSIFIVEDGRAVQRFVATGYENGNSVQILDGVSPGEKAIVSGAEKVRDGLTIDVVQNTRDGGADK